VHRRAHGLHHLWGEIVEADHGYRSEERFTGDRLNERHYEEFRVVQSGLPRCQERLVRGNEEQGRKE
jgi:hypothetical protein